MYPVEEIIEAESRFYDYYAGSATEGVTGTKWDHQARTVVSRLKDAGVDLRSGHVLDVSGGPGFVTQRISEIARRAVVTEFSDVAVEGMRKALGVEAAKFDYNTDDLATQVEGPFDVVLVDASINFSLDLASFASSLRRVCADGALIYVTFTVPTLGCCLRWEYDEYTYNVLYQPQTMAQAFSGAGFTLTNATWDESFHYRVGVEGKLRALRAPIEAAYRYGTRGQILMDPSLYQHTAVHYYRAS